MDDIDQSLSESRSLRAEEERDELLEVKRQSSKDTNRVRLWRIVVTGALFATATVVTLTTYRLLVDEEQKNFEIAVRWLIVVGQKEQYNWCKSPFYTSLTDTFFVFSRVYCSMTSSLVPSRMLRLASKKTSEKPM